MVRGRDRLHAGGDSRVRAAPPDPLGHGGLEAGGGDAKSHHRESAGARPKQPPVVHFTLQIVTPANGGLSGVVGSQRSGCDDELIDRLAGDGVGDRTVDQPCRAGRRVGGLDRGKRRHRSFRANFSYADLIGADRRGVGESHNRRQHADQAGPKKVVIRQTETQGCELQLPTRRLFNHGQQVTGFDLGSRGGMNRFDGTRFRRVDGGFHLHRFK